MPDDLPFWPDNSQPESPGRTITLRQAIFFGLAVVLLIGVIASWWILSVNLTPRTILISVTVQLVFMLVVLRLARGSLNDAEKLSQERSNTPVVPTKRLSKILAEGEIVYAERRFHPLMVWHWWLTGTAIQSTFVLSMIRVGPNKLLVYAWLVSLLICIYTFVRWWRDRICRTNWRVLRHFGVVRHRVTAMPIAEMTDLTLEVPILSSLLSMLRVIKTPYGTIDIESAGQDQAFTLIEFVPDVHAFFAGIKTW